MPSIQYSSRTVWWGGKDPITRYRFRIQFHGDVLGKGYSYQVRCSYSPREKEKKCFSDENSCYSFIVVHRTTRDATGSSRNNNSVVCTHHHWSAFLLLYAAAWNTCCPGMVLTHTCLPFAESCCIQTIDLLRQTNGAEIHSFRLRAPGRSFIAIARFLATIRGGERKG